MSLRSCVLLGATGLVGGQLLRLLLDDGEYGKVIVLTRRALGVGLANDKLVERVIDFAAPQTYREHLAVDEVFCCLGTTIKKAGSKEAFRKVDFEYPVTVARQAVEAGAGQYLIITAVGADPKSSFFYNQVKGEVEEALRALPFPRGVRIFHPSMFLGERTESRPAERVASVLFKATAPLFVGGLKRYRAIDSASVARALRNAVREPGGGVRVYEGEDLFELAARG